MAAPSTGKYGLRSEIFYEMKPARTLTVEEGKRVADDLRKVYSYALDLGNQITNIDISDSGGFRKVLFLGGM